MEKPQYMSFDAYMKRRRLYYNAALFQQDILYFSQIWRSHRNSYRSYCQTYSLFNDYDVLQDRILSYEKRIAAYRYELEGLRK